MIQYPSPDSRNITKFVNSISLTFDEMLYEITTSGDYDRKPMQMTTYSHKQISQYFTLHSDCPVQNCTYQNHNSNCK